MAPATATTTAPPAAGSDATAATYAISLESIRAAAKRIHGLAHRTPVLTCSSLDAAASANADGVQVRLFFKCENLQKIGAFKFRGATNAVKKVLERREANDAPLTFIAHSSGNHAQAVAVAARDAGCNAIIIMPHNTPAVKMNAVRGYGAQVVECGTSPLDRARVAAEWLEKTNGVFIHPNDAADVMSGQGTAVLELMEQAQDQFGAQLDAVLAPVGGGGLIAATAMAVKSTNPAIKVIGIEPEGAADGHASFYCKTLQGHATPPNTVSDGLRSQLGPNNFPVIRDHVDDIVLVSDDETVAAMKLVWERMKLVVEPSGAVPVASVLSHKLPLQELAATKSVVNIGIIISGGNVDLDELPWIKKQ